MRQVELLSSPLWDVLQEAATEPGDADLVLLWQEIEAAIADLDCSSQLSVAGEAILQITDVYSARSQLAFEEIHAVASQDGPVMSEDAFDRYVRQTMQIDFEQYIEPLIGLPCKAPQLSNADNTQSVVVEVAPRKLIEVLKTQQNIDLEVVYEEVILLAHDEDISHSQEAVARYLQQNNCQVISLAQLQRGLNLPLIDIWLSLLLAEQTYKWQQGDNFYQDAADFKLVVF